MWISFSVSLLRMLKLNMAARLKLGENRAGRMFRSLYNLDRGLFEKDVQMALKEWLLVRRWEGLAKENIQAFNRKVLKIAKMCWPGKLQMNGNLSWLYHNHKAYSGNVPNWVDWHWPERGDTKRFQKQFYHLLVGRHPAGGNNACCSRMLCKDQGRGSVLNHHFFTCVGIHSRNCNYFRESVRRMYKEYDMDGAHEIPMRMIDGILERPCGMWVGLLGPKVFDLGLKLRSIHEIHRIFTISSVMSWGRFYSVP